jgi:hypothetical protein
VTFAQPYDKMGLHQTKKLLHSKGKSLELRHRAGAGRMAQVAKCLPSKHQVLISNPSNIKKKKDIEHTEWEKNLCQLPI